MIKTSKFKPMNTNQIFHVNNNIRLLRISETPLKVFNRKPLKIKRVKISTDVNDKHFEKTIEQTTINYGSK